MISVDEALARLFALSAPLGTETVPLTQAAGRVLARDVVARRTQPPFAASAMDGYAVKAAEVETGAMFRVIGESAAGAGFSGRVGPGQALRIFTGAPVPEGADFVVIQEDTTRTGDLITLGHDLGTGANIRPSGSDFSAGATLPAPRRLSPADVALIASMNVAELTAHRKPRVALIATGNELVMPGEEPGPDQIIASNSLGLKALIEAEGADARLLPIARDTAASLTKVFELAAGADLIITTGGASVGDHDLVGPVAAELGMDQAFYKVAMRPGKPLMAGKMGAGTMIGLPGNPVSSMVCGHIFVLPVLRAMQGLPAQAAPRLTAALNAPLSQNGPREHYMRAKVDASGLRAFDRQDSALLGVLSNANALIVRPPHDPPRAVGDLVDYVAI